MRIDAHQHFWALERGDYDWLTPELAPIYRDFQPQDLRPLLDAHDIKGTVLVQAAASVAETEYMLSISEQHSFVLGVVGWVNFARADAPETIARLAAHPRLKGLRPMIQDIPDPDWMLRDDLAPAYEAMIAHDLVFDALTLPQHLANLRRLMARHPALRVVIDHASKPLIANGVIDEWAADMARLAAETPALVKLSGMVTEAGADWTVGRLQPYADHLLETFGPERMIWGSDWPVCTLASTYEQWIAATDTLLAGLTPTARENVLGGNATRFYRLDPA